MTENYRHRQIGGKHGILRWASVRGRTARGEFPILFPGLTTGGLRGKPSRLCLALMVAWQAVLSNDLWEWITLHVPKYNGQWLFTFCLADRSCIMLDTSRSSSAHNLAHKSLQTGTSPPSFPKLMWIQHAQPTRWRYKDLRP